MIFILRLLTVAAKKILRLPSLVFLAYMPTVSADLVIEITEGIKGAVPIAVVPFAKPSSVLMSEDIAKIISDNLERSGDLKPMSRSDMLSLPSKGEQVLFRDWSILGQRYLLIGSSDFDAASQQYKISYELYDVQSRQRILGEVVSGSENQLRDTAHFISDKVFEALTSVKGVFSTSIAYVTLEKEAGRPVYKLQVADADGRRARLIRRSAEPILSPSWSPDAKRLAYVSYENKRAAVYIQDISSGRRMKVSSYRGLNSAPAFSPDGSKLAMTLSKDGNAEIYVLDLRNNDLQRFTNHWAIDTEASWSADGASIVFTSDRGGGPQVYKQELAGGKPVRLTFEGSYNARPRYSLDGKKIYYVHQRSGGFNLAALDLESGQKTIMTETAMDESPSVAPNGSMLIYATQLGGKGVLAVVGINSGAKYFLPAHYGDVREPAWSPH